MVHSNVCHLIHLLKISSLNSENGFCLGSLVPVLAAGVLTTVCDEKANMADIGTFLTEMISLYSVHRAPLLSLRAAMIALLSNSYYHPVIVESLYSAVINSSTQVKLTACQLLELAIRYARLLLLNVFERFFLLLLFK